MTALRMRGLIGAGAAALVVGLSFTLGRTSAEPLVPRDGWTVQGHFSPLIETPNPLEIPEALAAAPTFGRWGTWTQQGGAPGRITSPPFVLPPYLAVPHHGFPGDTPNARIVVRCRSTGRELQVARLRTNTQWATAIIAVPPEFCAGEAVLEAATDRAASIVGVGTPFAVSRAVYQSHASFPARALVTLATWGVLSTIAIALAVLAAPRSRDELLTLGFAGLGVVGMLVFVAFHFSPALGRVVVWLAVLMAGGTIWHAHRRSPARLADVLDAVRQPLAVWLGVALFCVAYVTSADSGGGTWAVNGLFTPLRWSTDNQIPVDFAEALFRDVPRETIRWGPWLASDRTPLLAALLLIPRTVVLEGLGAVFGASFIAVGYTAAGITLLASWAAAATVVGRRWAAGTTRTVVWLLLSSAFVFFDTLYIWPKLLGATFVLLAFDALYRMARNETQGPLTLVAVTACAALAYLSHASNAFALVAVAAAFVTPIWRQGLRSVVFASAVAVVIVLPWSLWQATVQPGGNALLRQALANEPGFDARSSPILPSVVTAYRAMGLDGWLRAKAAAVKFVVGMGVDPARLGNVARYSPGTDVIGYLRVLDFFVLVRALGVAAAGVLLLPVVGWTRVPAATSAWASRAAAVGLGGLAVSLVTTLPIAYMHHQPSGAVLLLAIAGAMTLAACGPLVARAALACALGYFAVVWIVHPLAIAERLQWTAVAGVAYAVLFIHVATSDQHPDFAPGTSVRGVNT